MTFDIERNPSAQTRRSKPMAAAVVAALALLAGPAQAALQQVTYTTHFDGTPGPALLTGNSTANGSFDSSDGPGLDSGANNNIVRTHDFFEYNVSLSADTAEKDVRIQIALPPPADGQRVVEWAYLPPECRTGSTISADRQHIDCLMTDFSSAGTRSVYFRAVVLGSARNGTQIPAPSLQIQSAATASIAPASVPATLTVSAAPFYDVHLQALAQNTTGLLANNGPNGEAGFYHRFNVGLIARNPHGHGKKGVEQLDPSQPIDIDVDISKYPSSVRLDNWRATTPTSDVNAAIGGFEDGCGNPGNHRIARPSALSGGAISTYGRVAELLSPPSTTTLNTVLNGGDCTVLAHDRNQIRLRLTGVDTTLARYPTELNPANQSLDPRAFWVANKAVVLWTALNETDYPQNQTISHPATFQAIRGTSISNQVLNSDSNPANDTATHLQRNTTNGTTSKSFIPDAITASPPYASVRDSSIGSGNQVNQVAPGQHVGTQLVYNNTGTSIHQQFLLCEIIDRTAFDIAERFRVTPGAETSGLVIQYGAHAQGSPYFASTDSAPAEYEGNTPATRSVAGNSDYARARCDDPGINWFGTPQEAEAAGGLVYVKATKPSLAPNNQVTLQIYGLVQRESWAATIRVETPTPGVRVAGEPIPEGTIIRNRAEVVSTSMPALSTVNGLRDHIRVISSQTISRLKKSVIEPAAAASQVPVAAGTTMRYRIAPTYSTTYPPQEATVTVTDVLPQGLRYVQGSARVGGQVQEPQVTRDTPAAGLTTLRWSFVDRIPHLGQPSDAGAALPVIEYQARASQSLADDTVLLNQATISSPSDFDADCVYDTTQGKGFTGCTKASSAEVTIQSPPGFFVEKTAPQPTIEPGDPFEYTVNFISMGKELRAPDIPDIIDILPFVGDGPGNPARQQAARQPASSFDAGAYQLRAVQPATIDPNARIYYTRRAPLEIHNDPQDASNRIPDGSTRWCLASEFGTSGCPAHIGESTAIRISPAVTQVRANQLYEITLQMVTDPLRSYAGNIFANRAGTRPADASSTLLFVESQANLYVQISSAVSSLSGRVFADLDQNNVLDASDWALADQCITLSGTNRKGQAIELSMRTDAQGNYGFAEGVANRVYPGAACSGTPLPHFAGLLEGEYTLVRQPSSDAARQRDGAVHAGSAGGTVEAQRISQISLGAAVTASGYHFTVVPVQPVLTLQARIINDHGGSAQPADATLEAVRPDAPDTPVLSGASGAASLNAISLPIGTYRLGQQALPGYDSGTWSCVINGQPAVSGDSLTLDYGGTAVCTQTYDDRPAMLSLQKILDLQHGRRAVVSDFLLHAEGQGTGLPTLSGRTGEPGIASVQVPAGRYALREDNLPYFLAGAWVCQTRHADGSSTPSAMDDAVVTLGNGEDVLCSITNTDAPLRVSLDLVSTDHGDGQTSTGSGTDALPPVVLYVSPVRNPADRIPLNLGEAASSQLVPGEEYELSASQTRGYQTKLICHDGQNQPVALRLILGGQNISCSVERKRIPTTMQVVKALDGEVQLVPGTLNEYTLAYQVTVTHTGGADGIYDLVDAPAFDPDVEILSHSTSRNGQAMAVVPENGVWTLASQRPLAIDGSDSYRMQLRVRVGFGSNAGNDACVTGTGAAGHGLFNQVRLHNRQDGSAGAADTAATQTAEACATTPVPVSTAVLSIEKTSASRSAEVGDLITYRLRVRNTGEGPALAPVVVDRLPRGFSLEAASLRVQGASPVSVQHTGNRELRIQLDRVNASTSSSTASGNGEVLISYRVRLGVGAQEGDGTNRAHVECPTPNGATTTRCSNESRWKIQVKAGIFSEEACLAGQIFVDCNGNSLKDAEELGIPGVRLYLQNGTWLVSDEHGKYSHCGLRPRTHVLKVDGRTLPRRARLVTSSAQNSGDAESLFIDARKGMLHRADFIEGSCSATVIEQVKARQAQGANTSVQTETDQPALSFESKTGAAAAPLREGTDGAAQARPQQRR